MKDITVAKLMAAWSIDPPQEPQWMHCVKAAGIDWHPVYLPEIGDGERWYIYDGGFEPIDPARIYTPVFGDKKQ